MQGEASACSIGDMGEDVPSEEQFFVQIASSNAATYGRTQEKAIGVRAEVRERIVRQLDFQRRITVFGESDQRETVV